MLGRASIAISLLIGLFLFNVPFASSQEEPPADSPTLALDRHRGTIAGFTDHVSAATGDAVSLFVTTPAPTFDAEVYRLGWYAGGAESADLVLALRLLPGAVQPDPLVDADSGLISASNWSNTGSFTIDGWRSGLYLVKLIAADGDQAYIPLVVRDDVGSHDYLFEHASATDQAYNAWGGKSLYDFNSTGPQTVSGTTAAVKVSFDRPLDGIGAGGSLRYELNMIRWLEASGFDVAYVSDLDVHRDPAFATRARAIIQAGHNEYWSKEMRDHLEAARDEGKGLGFFTGDTGAWAIRFEDSALGTNHVEVGYKLAPDPIAASDPSATTGHWRDAPLNRPTQQFIGVGSGMGVERSGDWVVEGADAASDLFSGTGFFNGDVVPNLVGYEYDGIGTPGVLAESPPGLRILGRARVAPLTRFDATVALTAEYKLPRTQWVPAGWLGAKLGTDADNPNWQVLVHLVSAGHSDYLVYAPGPGTPHHYSAEGDVYGWLPLGPELEVPGWHPFDRDLVADYSRVFGAAPEELKVSSIVLRGSLSLGPVSLASPTRDVEASVSVGSARTPDAAGWLIRSGSGTLSLKPLPDGSAPALVMQVPLLPDRRPDEAHTVAIRNGAGVNVVAVGSIQWSWALDDLALFGAHADGRGNQTQVDARVQALTRNLMRALAEPSTADN